MALLSLIAKLGLDKTGFDAGLSSANKQAEKFGGNLKKQLAGAFSVAAIGIISKQLADAASRLNDLSIKSGISTDSLQEIDYAAKQSGLTVEDFTDALGKLAKARKEALEDRNGATASAFQRLGISFDTLKNARLEDVMGEIGSAMQQSGDAQLFLTDAMEIFGQSASKLIPALAGDFDRLRQSAKDAGQVISESSIAAIDTWQDKFGNFVQAAKVKATEFLGFLANFHNKTGSLLDAIGATFTAPFTEGGFKEAQARWNTVLKMRQNELLGKPFEIKMNQGPLPPKPINQFGEWQGPMQPEQQAAELVKLRTRPAIQSDAFGRIGAFTGAAAQSAQLEISRRQLSQLEQLRADLIRRGILVKGTD